MVMFTVGNMKSHNNSSSNKLNISAREIATIGMMVAIIEACKIALSFLPNVELTSFWLIMFTIFYGRKVGFVVPVFILVEGAMYGMNTWWIMYLYIWPLLVFIAWIFRKSDSAIFWAILSGIFGLSFGFLCSLVYFFMGFSAGGVAGGFSSAFSWWVAGIPWDLIHGTANFILMLVLYKPVSTVMKKYL